MRCGRGHAACAARRDRSGRVPVVELEEPELEEPAAPELEEPAAAGQLGEQSAAAVPEAGPAMAPALPREDPRCPTPWSLPRYLTDTTSID